jgi:hypothetical protein
MQQKHLLVKIAHPPIVMCYGGIAKEYRTYIDSVDASMIGSNFICISSS